MARRHTQSGRKIPSVIHPRPRVGPITTVLISVGFALLATPIVMADAWLGAGAEPSALVAGQPSPVTVRVAQFSSADRRVLGVEGGPIVAHRGEILDAGAAARARAALALQPSGPAAWLAFFAGLLLVGLLYTSSARRTHKGRLVRAQVATLAALLLVALIVKLLLLFTSLSPLVIPVAALAILVTLTVDLSVGLATGLVAAVLMGLLVPFDLGVIAVLGIQAAATVLILGDDQRRRNRHVLLAGVFGGVMAAAAYAVFTNLSGLRAPLTELRTPLSSPGLAAALGGLLSAALAVAARPLYQFALGEITKNKLVELEDLSNPMLRQIAEKSPGTWQHSLAMANMAEIATNAVGGNGRLVRVGAYYHDLGKSLQPKYFIENLEPGESSPHDRLAPEVSCDAIFAHVTEGIAHARKQGLPERIIDFMHMHHGDGLLEYFWSKCREQGNPKSLSEEDFRYPGLRPQSRETAILAIVDAVEAASRTLKNPDERAIGNLVQRIVYGKLHLGQLDESGLSMADLRRISNSLRETIKHAHHGRIEYPWQREAREEEKRAAQTAAATVADRPAAPEPASSPGRLVTQQLIAEPRLDSLDVPRPYWRARTRAGTTREPAGVVGSESGSLRSGLATTGVADTQNAPLPSASEASSSSGSTDGAGAATGAGPGTADAAGEMGTGPTAAVPRRRAPTLPGAGATTTGRMRAPTSSAIEASQAGSAGATPRVVAPRELASAAPAPDPYGEEGPTAQAPITYPASHSERLRVPQVPPTGYGDEGGTVQVAYPATASGPITIAAAETSESPPPAASQSTDELAPGVLVIGPPPATRPRTVTGAEEPGASAAAASRDRPAHKPASPVASMMPPRASSKRD